MQPNQFRFHHALRVRWGEVDVQQIVFNPHYLMYFDVAMSEYWRALALPYAATMARLNGEIYLRKTSVEFNASAVMDDRLDVAMRCERIGTSSMSFVGGIFRGDQLLVQGELIYVFADPASPTSLPVPAPLRAWIEAYEAGQPVTQVRLGDWAALGAEASAVRTAVFIEEQGIAREDEWDAADATAVHAVVANHLGMPVATGRLLREGEAGSAVSRIGRMAVLQPLRGGGAGRQVMQALEQAARERGDREVILSAQRSAEGFYRRLGYAASGDTYLDVGIPHVDMRRPLG